jgi:replicative DNA helicase
MENAEARLMEISDMTASASAVLLGDMGDDILSHLQSRAKRMKEKGIVGLPTPLKELDRITLGFQTGLIYLAARTAMGKTTFAIQCAQKTSKSGFPTAFFSIEMSAMQLALKILQSEGKISGDDNKFRTANFNDTEWYIINTQIDLFKKSKLFIDDRTTDIGQICQKLRRLVKKQGVRFAVIDYLQLISSKSTKGNREQEVAHISWKLKMLSKELDIPIMVLAQLNREVDKAPGHVPQLSHLRESGSVEQDADMVLFLLRLRYYGVDVWPDGSSTKDTAQVIIAKQREGPIDDFICGYYGHQATFFDLNSYGGAPDGFTPMSQALRDPSKSKEIVDEETGEIQYPDGRPWENF